MLLMETAFYIHTLDPVLLPLWGHLAIRWYGLAYLAGFAAAWMLLSRWGRRGTFPVSNEDLSTLMTAMIVGVMLGGRLGYVLLYDFPTFRADPMTLFRLWEGGMASHGGMIGMAVAVWWYARYKGTSFLRIADGLCCVGPIGVVFGRLANFINGELWGRVTTMRWAVLFPQEAGLDPTAPGIREIVPEYVALGLIQPRHPSQLYSALLEGVLVLTILLLLRRTRWAEAPGRLTAVFFCAYAAARITAECFREPEIVYFGWLTQGQVLSAALLIPAVLLLKHARQHA